MTTDVMQHDIWTDKTSGNDVVVLSVGLHLEHNEKTVAFTGSSGIVRYMSLDLFLDHYELTHRIYKDYY